MVKTVEDPREAVQKLAPGSATVLRTSGGRLAVYKDDQGVVHSLSATCTHMGCLVTWNDTEKTWDCPCHGSRFGFDGAVVNGPAAVPLGKKPVT